MSESSELYPALVVGGGMITREVVLPTLCQLQRSGEIGDIAVCSRRGRTLAGLREMYPNQPFRSYPEESADPEESFPGLYKRAIEDLPPGGMVLVATPDHLHTPVVLHALDHGKHCVVQKPLCLKTDELFAIRNAADAQAMYVLTDYHKRHDPAVRSARHRFRKGDLGEMLHGHAWIEERREIPFKHFALWIHNSSPFEYVGVHYVDAYYYITGLKPRRVVAFGQKKLLKSHGKDAFDAVQAVVEWEDSSTLWVQTSWVLSDNESALTNQGLMLHGTDGEYWADHKARNCRFITEKDGYEDYNPNFFRTYDSWDPEHETDVWGYGFESIAQGVRDIVSLQQRTASLSADDARHARREILDTLAPKRALPQQALVGTSVNEAVRLSIANNNAAVVFNEHSEPRLAE